MGFNDNRKRRNRLPPGSTHPGPAEQADPNQPNRNTPQSAPRADATANSFHPTTGQTHKMLSSGAIIPLTNNITLSENQRPATTETGFSLLIGNFCSSMSNK
ncbi:MAG: hypothetical protein JWM43_2894 [Acidobacteriaceae bacterium]|nr:hypothetical protein [Acidobacteriaceae bacterium]